MVLILKTHYKYICRLIKYPWNYAYSDFLYFILGTEINFSLNTCIVLAKTHVI